jgi:hypothetical protein
LVGSTCRPIRLTSASPASQGTSTSPPGFHPLEAVQRGADLQPERLQLGDTVQGLGVLHALAEHRRHLDHDAVDRRAHLQGAAHLAAGLELLHCLARHPGQDQDLTTLVDQRGRLVQGAAGLQVHPLGDRLGLAELRIAIELRLRETQLRRRLQQLALQADEARALDVRQDGAGLDLVALGRRQGGDQAAARGGDHADLLRGDAHARREVVGDVGLRRGHRHQGDPDARHLLLADRDLVGGLDVAAGEQEREQGGWQGRGSSNAHEGLLDAAARGCAGCDAPRPRFVGDAAGLGCIRRKGMGGKRTTQW